MGIQCACNQRILNNVDGHLMQTCICEDNEYKNDEIRKYLTKKHFMRSLEKMRGERMFLRQDLLKFLPNSDESWIIATKIIALRNDLNPLVSVNYVIDKLEGDTKRTIVIFKREKQVQKICRKNGWE